MTFDTSLIIYFSLTVAILGLVTAAITLSFLPLLRWIYSFYREEGKKRDVARKEAIEILAKARGEADQLLTGARRESAQTLAHARQEAERQLGEAQQRAVRTTEAACQEVEQLLQLAKEKTRVMVEQTKKIEDEGWENYRQSLKSLAEKQRTIIDTLATTFVNDFRQSLQKVGEGNLNRFRQIAGQISSGAQIGMKGFEEALHQELQTSQQRLTEQVEASYAAAQKSIDDYKKEKLQKIEEAIYKIVFQVSEKVIGKALNLQEHQELVRQALHDITRAETAQL